MAKQTLTNAQKEELRRLAKMELCRRNFWEYCKEMAPDFYMEDREFLKSFCGELQDFYESDDTVMVVNVPPRHGKSRTAQMLVQWIFGNDVTQKVMTGSYNETLATTFARGVRNTIMEKKIKGGRTVYHDIFPKTVVKRGDAAANLWSLEGGFQSYLATSPSGTATGFGASLLILDDVIKNAEEAFNEALLDKQWECFTQTLLSRVEKGGKILIIMTRWSSKDLAGRALEHYAKIGAKLRHINYKAVQDDGTMLCDAILDKQSFDDKKEAIGIAVVEANYQQNPLDLRGRLYSGFKTYDEAPLDKFEEICCYTDTADEGSDSLASIIYGRIGMDCYVLDVYFTTESMEITEGETARRLSLFKVNRWYCESNNGGRGFGRSVERIMREKHHNYRCYTELFYQSRNKTARIITAATWCQDHIFFPIGWEFKWHDFHTELMSYVREAGRKNKHDDAPDALTGIYDRHGKGSVYDFN